MAYITFRNSIVEVDGKAYSAPLVVLRGVFTGELALSRERVEGSLTVEDSVNVSVEDEAVFITQAVDLKGPTTSIGIREAPRGVLVSIDNGRYKGAEATLMLEKARAVVNLVFHPLNIKVVVENPYIEVEHRLFGVAVKARSL